MIRPKSFNANLDMNNILKNHFFSRAWTKDWNRKKFLGNFSEVPVHQYFSYTRKLKKNY